MVILKGPCLLGASFIVSYGLRFFASSQAICPCFHFASMGAFFCAVLLRVSIARVLLFHKLSACYLAETLFKVVSCLGVSEGSHLIRSWLRGNLVMVLAKLLWTRVAMANQLLQFVWFAVMRCRYCSIH